MPQAHLDGHEEIRAKKTIKEIGLNRKKVGHDLVQERGKEFSQTFMDLVYTIKSHELQKISEPRMAHDYQDAINLLKEKLEPFIASKRTFAGVYRDYLSQNDIDYTDLIEE